MNGKIVLKPGRKTIINVCLVGALILLLSVLLITAFSGVVPVPVTVGLAVFLVLMMLRLMTAYGKTVIFGEEGIQISFLFAHRIYPWDKILTRECVDYHNLRSMTTGGVDSRKYRRGAVFSTGKVKNRCRLLPEVYSYTFHPWSMVYVNFDNHEAHLSKAKLDHIGTPVVDEFRFRSQLAEWGIELN